MEIGGRKLLVCNCEGTMTLDGKRLAKACAAAEAPFVNSQLCRAQLENFRAAVAAGRPLLVACTQEQPLFDEVLRETGLETQAAYVNIRERAGWSVEGPEALPKIAALLAEAAVEIPPAPSVSLKSEGICLVYGSDEAALAAAQQLGSRLAVTLLLTKPGEITPPQRMEVPVSRGTIVAARGHLGAFELTIDDYAPSLPSSRGMLTFEPSRNGASSRCDLILDLSGAAPLFSAHARREGYLRPDPRNPAAVQRALFDLVDLVGEFEKPRYVAFDPALCAHSRSRKIGCTRCLDVCPASAIRPDGDVVAIDPYLCGGCGACHSVCPTGAAAYTMPPSRSLGERLRTLLGAYDKAGGKNPVLLVHDPRRGEELVAALARHGSGLPAMVLPFAVNEVTQLGFDFLALAFAYGAAQLVVLAHPEQQSELGALAGQLGFAETMLAALGFGSGRLQVLSEADPDAVERALYALPELAPVPRGDFLPMGDKRSLIRLALAHLGKVAPTPQETVPLAAGAPFGAVALAVEGCTLCLACVGACPTGALQDNPDRPQLRFQEDACVQCGLCKATCPEKVIALVPRLNFTGAAASAMVLKEEEPFACINCGKPFGTRSSIARVLERLAGKHAMFQAERMVRLIQMCEDCRVVVQFEGENQPLAGAPRPRPRTTDDDLQERAERQRRGEPEQDD
jgi:ferredoxin